MIGSNYLYSPFYSSYNPQTFFVNSGFISGNIQGNFVKIQLDVLTSAEWSTIIKILAQQAWTELIFYHTDLNDKNYPLIRVKGITKNNLPFQISGNSFDDFYSKLPASEIMPIDQQIAEKHIEIVPHSLSAFQITCSCMQDKTQDESNYCSHIKQLFSTAETYFTQNPFRFFRFRGQEPYKIITQLQELHSSNIEADADSNSLSALVFTPETCDSDQNSDFWNGHIDSPTQISKNISISMDSTLAESGTPPWGPFQFSKFLRNIR